MAFYKISCPFFKCEYVGKWEETYKSYPVCKFLEAKDEKGRSIMDILNKDCSNCEILNLTYTKRRKLYYHYFPEEKKKKTKKELEQETLQDEELDIKDI